MFFLWCKLTGPATFLTSERPSADKPAADLYALEVARSVFCSEPESGRKANSGFVKYITGNDMVNARNPHGTTITSYRPRFLVTLLCNTIPLFQGAETEVRGLWRRLKIIKFEMEFVADPQLPHERKLDTGLEERTESWGPEFMLMLIERYRAYVANNSEVSIPAKVEHNLQEQREENDPFPSWFEQTTMRKVGAKIHLHILAEQFNAANLGIQYDAKAMRRKLIQMRLPLSTNRNDRVNECYCGIPRSSLNDYQFNQEGI